MLWWAVQNFATSTVLAAMFAVACRCLRLGPVVRHALWLIVLIKLVTPPLIAWPWAIGQATPKPVISLQQTLPTPTPLPPPSAAIQSRTVIIGTAPPRLDPPPQRADTPKPAPLPQRDSFGLAFRIAAITWVAGASAFASLQLLRILRMLARLRRAADADPTFQERVDALARRLGCGAVRARIVPGLASPVIFSLVRPQLLWPQDLPPCMSDSSRDGLVLHELAHVRRGDHHVGWLELIAGIVWWWNPLYWYVRHQLRENAELACDSWVVQTLPRGGRRAYADGLLAVCESLSGRTKRQMTPLPAVGINTGGRQFLERRLTMLFRDQIPLRLSRTAWVSLLVLVLGALPAWSQKSPSGEGVSDAVDRTSVQRQWRTYVDLSASISTLPADAEQLVQQSQSEQERARSEYEKKIAESRENLIGGLQKLQEKYTKAGKLDEAVAIRDTVRELQRGGATNNNGVGFTTTVTPPVTFSPGPIEPVDPNLSAYRGQAGKSIDIAVTGTTQGSVWGTDIYTDDSTIGTAAVHAGVLRDGETRIVRITILNGQENFTGSTRNGVTSGSYGPWPGSFRFEQPLHSYGGQVSHAGINGILQSMRGKDGTSVVCEVTGSTQGTVWGTDMYTDDSSIAAAAVHAGILKDGEKGMVVLTVHPGQASYTGSTRNGVTTQDYRDWGGSFTIGRLTLEPATGGAVNRLERDLGVETREAERF